MAKSCVLICSLSDGQKYQGKQMDDKRVLNEEIIW